MHSIEGRWQGNLAFPAKTLSGHFLLIMEAAGCGAECALWPQTLHGV